MRPRTKITYLRYESPKRRKSLGVAHKAPCGSHAVVVSAQHVEFVGVVSYVLNSRQKTPSKLWVNGRVNLQRLKLCG